MKVVQRFVSFSSRVDARHAGEGLIEFGLIAGSIALAAFVFLTALAPRLIGEAG